MPSLTQSQKYDFLNKFFEDIYLKSMPNPKIPKGVKLTCTSIDCPERKSLCCGGRSMPLNSYRGTDGFVCSKCKKEFIGPECNADERIAGKIPSLTPKQEKEFDSFMIKEYGKWKIGRVEAKSYLALKLQEQREECKIEKSITAKENYEWGKFQQREEFKKVVRRQEIATHWKGECSNDGYCPECQKKDSYNQALTDILKDLEL